MCLTCTLALLHPQGEEEDPAFSVPAELLSGYLALRLASPALRISVEAAWPKLWQKLEDLHPLTIEELVFMCDGEYDRAEHLEMERHILGGLGFQVSVQCHSPPPCSPGLAWLRSLLAF